MTKANWLRSEIEKLEDELDRIKKYQIMVGEHKYYCECKAGNDYLDKFLQVLRDDSKQLTSIITRYKEELKDLTGE